MRILKIYLALTCAALLLTGFSWGLGTDQCKETLEMVDSLESVQDDTLMRQTEAKIISLCPDGAAAHFVNALQLERVGNIDDVIADVARHCDRMLPLLVPGGNLGLLYA